MPITPPITMNEKSKEIFIKQINSDETKEKILELEQILNGNKDSTIETAVGKLTHIYNYNFVNKNISKKTHNIKQKPKKWYDKTCYEVSKQFKLVAKLFAASPKNPYLRGSYIKTRKEYKKLLKYKKIEYQNQIIKKLENMEDKNPQEYWKLIKELREKKYNKTISDPEEFTNFFENVFAANTQENKQTKD